MLVDQPGDEWTECCVVFRQYKIRCFLGPIELVAGRKRGDPYLPDRRVGSYHEFARRFLEDDTQCAAVFFDLKLSPLFGGEQTFLEGFERDVGVPAEGQLIEHSSSVASSAGGVRQGERPWRGHASLVHWSFPFSPWEYGDSFHAFSRCNRLIAPMSWHSPLRPTNS